MSRGDVDFAGTARGAGSTVSAKALMTETFQRQIDEARYAAGKAMGRNLWGVSEPMKLTPPTRWQRLTWAIRDVRRQLARPIAWLADCVRGYEFRSDDD